MVTERALIPGILYEDNNIIVLSKPAGLLSQGERKGQANLVDWLRTYWHRKYVGLIHRLDRNTSGVMVVAKRTKGAQRLSRAITEGKCKRLYRAWVAGRIKGQMTLVNKLIKDRYRNVVKAYAENYPKGKRAELSVKPIGYGKWQAQNVTLAEFHLKTGRSHQIRIQSAYAGHPLIGDVKYNRSRKKHSVKRPLLHACAMTFPHPITGEALTFRAPLPPDMRTIKLTRRQKR